MNKISIYTAVILTALSIYSCKQNTEAPPANEKFCLSDTMQQKITLATVQLSPVNNVIALSGKIEANEDKWVKVFPVVNGVVEQMKVQLGDYVTKGQTLAVIHSAEIADYQSQETAARSTVTISEKNLSSAKTMRDAGLATDKDVVAAETDLEKAKADLERSLQTAKVYGAKPNAIQVITAPISGYIIEKNATEQMQYKADGSQPFFVIANLEEVWVMANVFESDIARIKLGYDAEIRSIAYPGKVFTGKVDRIFSILDPQSRVMKVRIRIPNTENLLKPEMYAQINIHYNDGSTRLPAIPAESVIFDKNRNYVMIYNDKCNIQTREIEPYETIGDTAYIKNGLAPGDRIITKYQLLVYDAIND